MDLEAIEQEISKQCQSLPRGEFASKALGHSFMVFARDMLEVSQEFPSFVLSNLDEVDQQSSMLFLISVK